MDQEKYRAIVGSAIRLVRWRNRYSQLASEYKPQSGVDQMNERNSAIRHAFEKAISAERELIRCVAALGVETKENK